MSSGSTDSKFINALGSRVHYQLIVPIFSKTVRDTIVLIHGFLCNMITWYRCFQPLADRTRCRILAYDRFTFGLTERVLDEERYCRKHEEQLALELSSRLQITERVR